MTSFLFKSFVNRGTLLQANHSQLLQEWSLQLRAGDKLFSKVYHYLSSATLHHKLFILNANFLLIHVVVTIVVLQSLLHALIFSTSLSSILLCAFGALVRLIRLSGSAIVGIRWGWSMYIGFKTFCDLFCCKNLAKIQTSSWRPQCWTFNTIVAFT